MWCSENVHSFTGQRNSKVYGSLTSKLHHHSIGVFFVYYAHNIFQGDGLEVKFTGYVIISTYCLRIVVNYNSFNILIFKSHCCVDTAVVKFYALADTYGSSTNNYNLFLISNYYFIFIFIGTIIIGCLCFKFCCTGIYHFICWDNSFFFPGFSNSFFF